MNLVATLVLLAWPVLIASMFLVLKPGRAAMVALVVGWLFLPLTTLNVPGLPPYGKFTATALALLPMILLFDAERLFAWRPTWIDLPIIVWLFAPIPTALTNGLGLWDGVAGLTLHTLLYGVPYLVGRLYLRAEQDWLFLGKVIVIAACCYVPLCLFEMRVSPQLHDMIYGFPGRTSYKTRLGIGPLQWIPVVFMNSEFELNMLMVLATLVSFWAWWTGYPKRLVGMHPFLLFLGFAIMAVLCRKWSGIGLMFGGLAVLVASERLRTSIFAWCLVLMPIVYMTVFVTNIWRCEGVTDTLALISDDRAASLQFRIDNDKLLAEKALERPIFGWGGWGRNRVYDENGKDISITDSMWMITLGTAGTLGLASLTLVYGLPFMVFLGRYPPQSWAFLPCAAVAPLAIFSMLHLIDNLFNAFPNVMYPLIAGGVATISTAPMPIATSSQAGTTTRAVDRRLPGVLGTRASD